MTRFSALFRDAVGDYASVLLAALAALLMLLSTALAISHARPVAGDPDDVMTFYRRLVAFDQKYMPMINTACGFEGKEPPARPMCDPRTGRIDNKQFSEAREKAKTLFQLTEK